MSKILKYLPITSLLAEIIDNRGKTVPTSDKGLPLIATNCIKHSSIYPTFDKVRYVDEHTLNTWFRAHLQPNDILFVNKGTPGRVCLVPNPVNFCAAQDMMGFRCNEKLINYKYLFAVLRSNETQKKIENNHVGLVIPHMRKQDLPSLLIPIRSKEEQAAIGNLYITLSEKIELNNRINAELETMAKTLYDYWFVQFDFPDANGKPYKTSGGKMVWNEELKREIPEGWNVGELSDIANIVMGQSPPGESYNEDGDGMIFFQGCTDFGTRFPSVRQFTTQPTRFANEGDILLSVRAPVGAINIAKENCCIGRGLAALNSKDNCIAYLLGVMINLKQIFDRRNVDGTTFGSITKDDLFSLKVVRPERGVLEKFNDIISPAFKKQNKIANENQYLASLRDWLLPMLMNGQVAVAMEEKVGYQAEEELKAAAEPATKNYSNKQLQDFYQKQIIGLVIKKHREKSMQHGEMVLAKDLYLLDKIYGINTHFQFVNWHFGTYDPKIRILINGKDKYFKKTKVGTNDTEVLDLGDRADNLFNAKYHKPELDLVEQGMNDLLGIYSTFPFKERSKRIELLNTVCKIISDTQKLDIDSIREAMKLWETPKSCHKTKAERFTKEETQVCIGLILEKGWDKKLISYHD